MRKIGWRPFLDSPKNRPEFVMNYGERTSHEAFWYGLVEAKEGITDDEAKISVNLGAITLKHFVICGRLYLG